MATMMCVCVLTDWDKLIVDGAETTSIIVPDLAADEEYCVKMKSLSVIGDSHYTEPLKHRVFRAGNVVLLCFCIAPHKFAVCQTLML